MQSEEGERDRAVQHHKGKVSGYTYVDAVRRGFRVFQRQQAMVENTARKQP